MVGDNAFKEAAKFRPQGTWNLYLGCGNFRGWCDCTTGKLWKNSTLSNPMYHTTIQPYNGLGSDTSPNGGFTPNFWCGCHIYGAGDCVVPNLGEMESVTCHL